MNFCCLLNNIFVGILENHRLESSYQNHLILKVLVVSMSYKELLRFFKKSACAVFH